MCYRLSRRAGDYVSCEMCKKTVYRQKRFLLRKTEYFCSRDCNLRHLNGNRHRETHPNWTTGKASYRTTLLQSQKVRVCNRCCTTEMLFLVVHHMDLDRNNNSLSNLVWLCQNCHFLVHTYKNERDGLQITLKPCDLAV